MFGEWTVYKQSCTIASGVKDCGLVFSPSPHFFLLTFLDQLDKRMDGRVILPSVSAWLFSGEKQNKCTVKKNHNLLYTFDFFVNFTFVNLIKAWWCLLFHPFESYYSFAAPGSLPPNIELLILNYYWEQMKKILSIHKIEVFLFWCIFHVSYCFTT